VFFTISDVALLARRSPRTIANLMAKHSLPRKRSWTVRRGHRQRVVTVRRDVAAWLIAITLHGDREALKSPPR
jgi:hypothetical protein